MTRTKMASLIQDWLKQKYSGCKDSYLDDQHSPKETAPRTELLSGQ